MTQDKYYFAFYGSLMVHASANSGLKSYQSAWIFQLNRHGSVRSSRSNVHMFNDFICAVDVTNFVHEYTLIQPGSKPFNHLQPGIPWTKTTYKITLGIPRLPNTKSRWGGCFIGTLPKDLCVTSAGMTGRLGWNPKLRMGFMVHLNNSYAIRNAFRFGDFQGPSQSSCENMNVIDS